MGSRKRASSNKPRKPRDSSIYEPDELSFLRSRLPMYFQTARRSQARSLFITESAELFLEMFNRPRKATGLLSKLKDLKQEIRRWYINAGRYNMPSEATNTHGDPSGTSKALHRTLEDEPGPTDRDLNVLATLFGVQLGYEATSAFRLFVDDNLERIARLVSDELVGVEPGERRKKVAGITRRIQSREFSKLTQEELARYQSEAIVETEKSRRAAEAPASAETILKNQLGLDNVLHKILSALLEDGPLSIGKGAFHIQYTLVGQSGPFSKTLCISSCNAHYPWSEEYRVNKIEDVWVRWSADQLLNELHTSELPEHCIPSLNSDDTRSEAGSTSGVHLISERRGPSSTIDLSNQLNMICHDNQDLSGTMNVVQDVDLQNGFLDANANESESGTPYSPSPSSLPNADDPEPIADDPEPIAEPLPISAEAVKTISVEALRLGECQIASVTESVPMRPGGISQPLQASQSDSISNKPSRKQKSIARTRGDLDQQQAQTPNETRSIVNPSRSKRLIKVTERAGYLREEALQKNARRLQRQLKK